MAKDIQQDIKAINVKQSKMMNILEEIVSEEEDAKMHEEITSVNVNVSDWSQMEEEDNIRERVQVETVEKEFKSIGFSHRDDEMKVDGKINNIFKSEDIREKSQVMEDVNYEKKWVRAIEREKEAYLDDINATSIPNVEVEFSITEDGYSVAKATVESKYIKVFPAAEDQMTLECEGFSQKAKVMNVTGFKEISISRESHVFQHSFIRTTSRSNVYQVPIHLKDKITIST